MKSYLVHACLIAMLLLPTVASATIVPDCNRVEDFSSSAGSSLSGDTGYTGAYTGADGTYPYSWAEAEAYETFTVTGQNTTCNYSYYIYAYAEADMYCWDGEFGTMAAYATASGYCQASGENSSLEAGDGGWIYVQGSGYGGQHMSDADNQGHQMGSTNGAHAFSTQVTACTPNMSV